MNSVDRAQRTTERRLTRRPVEHNRTPLHGKPLHERRKPAQPPVLRHIIKWHRQHHHKARRNRLDLIKVLRAGRSERRFVAAEIERFHLPEPQKHTRRVHRIKLVLPRPEIHVAPLLVNRVTLPRHAPEPRLLFLRSERQRAFKTSFLH